MTTLEASPTRRSLFTLGAAASLALAGSAASADAAERLTDQEILNFALNLEYLEGEFYLRGVTGQGLDQAIGSSLGGSVRGGRAVSFPDPRHRSFLEDVARNELAHVRFIRGALDGTAVARPAIDFDSGFAAVAQGAGLGPNFDPFADERSFYIAAFLFEDVGVTAYKGAAPLLSSKEILEAAAGIEAVEAYHAGCIRTVLYKMGPDAQQAAGRVSDMRRRLNGDAQDDEGIVRDGRANIVPAARGIAYSRKPPQVLNIVFANGSPGVTRGGFFPQGIDGTIRST